MPLSGYDTEEQLRIILDACRQIMRRTGTVRQADLREELRRQGSPIISETPMFQKLGIRITDVKRHLIQGEPLIPRRGEGKNPGSTEEIIKNVTQSTPNSSTNQHILEVDPEEPPDPEEVWSRLKDHAAKRIEKEVAQRFRSVDLSCGGPVGLMMLGDLHIGHQATDYDRIDWCCEQVSRKDVPVYSVQVGDVTDNLFWVPSEIAKQNTEIPEQALAAARVFGLMGENLIGIVPGNHDQFGQNRSGHCIWDTVVALCPNLIWDPNELVLDVVVGDIRYRLVVRHKVRGRSQYRASHGVDRWHIFNDTHLDADAIIAGDIHQSGYSHREMKGKKRHGVQLGAYKSPEGIGDEYATRMGFAYGNYHADMFAIFHPDRREIEVFESTERGITVLEALWRTKKAEGKKQTPKRASRSGGSSSRRTGRRSTKSTSGTKANPRSRASSKKTQRRRGK